MAQLKIYSCFSPVLKKKTTNVVEIDSKIKKLVDDMFETMYKADGLGLAANQVGLLESIIVIDPSAVESKHEYSPIALINPEIINSSEEESEYREGCLSVPTIYENVKRPKIVQVRYFDVNGSEKIVEDDDFLSRVMQHEIDHLNGILFFERISSLRRTLIKKTLSSIKRGDIDVSYPMIFNGQE
jgi:peptide deformylase